MDFKSLDYFIVLAESKNITEAAKKLNLTQPTLSIFLRTLEDSVGNRLFERMGKTLIMTYAGERYYHYAKEIIATRNGMMHELSELHSENSGSLGVTCMLPRSTFLIPATIPIYKKQHPGISIQLAEEISYEAMEHNIFDGTSILGIGNYASTDPHITTQLIAEEEMLLVTRADHPVAQTNPASRFQRYPYISLKDFRDDMFIIPRKTRTAHLAQSLLEQTIGQYNLFLETRNIETALRLTAEGLGVTFLCHIHARFPYLPQNLRFFSISDNDTKIPLNILYRTNGYLPDYAQDYIDLLYKYANDQIFE